MKYTKTLKKLSQILGVSYYRILKIRDSIADSIRRDYKDWGIPNKMIFGEKGYLVKRFKEYL